MMGLPNCTEVSRQLSMECEIHRRRRPIGLRLHLLMCRACRRYQRYLAWIEANLPRALAAARDASLSPAQRTSIKRTLRGNHGE